MAEKKTYEELEKRIRELEEQLKGGGNREYKSRLFGFFPDVRKTSAGRCHFTTPSTARLMMTSLLLPSIQLRTWSTWA